MCPVPPPPPHPAPIWVQQVAVYLKALQALLGEQGRKSGCDLGQPFSPDKGID